MPKYLLVILLLTCLLFSMIAKFYRYSSAKTYENQSHIESITIQSLSNKAWSVKSTYPLTTNKSSMAIIFEHEYCPLPLIIHVLSHDLSDQALLSQTFENQPVNFSLAGKPISNWLILQYYRQYLLNRIKSIIKKSPYTHNPIIAFINNNQDAKCLVSL